MFRHGMALLRDETGRLTGAAAADAFRRSGLETPHAAFDINLVNLDLKFRFTRMIPRFLENKARELLSQFPAVALLGPRQVGKTTLARKIGDAQGALYLDLEHPADLAKLADPADYLARHPDKLVILDEIHRLPEVFPVLRSAPRAIPVGCMR